MKNILITGCAGFIGSHLSQNLLNKGFCVIGIDNFNDFYAPEIKENNILKFQNDPSFSLYKSDISDKTNLHKIFTENKIDIVVHLAASAGVRPSIENPIGYTQNNITEHVALLNAMQKYGVQKIVFASSSSVYGNLKDVPFHENMKLDNVQSPYAATKLSSEIFNKLYHDIYHFSVINLRFFTVYGPGQRPDLAIHKFTKMIYNEEKLKLYGYGELERDYTYIDDIIEGISGAIERIKESEDKIFETYNLGNNSPVRTIDLVKLLGKIIGKEPKYELCETPKGDVKITYANIENAKKNLNYNPKTNFEDGLTNFWEWYKKTFL